MLATLESAAPRRAPPFLPRFRWCNRGIVQRLDPRAKSGMLRSPLLHLLNDLLQFIRHRWNGFAAQLDLARSTFPDHDVEAVVLIVLRGVIFPELRAAAFFSLEGRPRNHLRHNNHVLQVDGGMPTSVVFAVSGHSGALGLRFKFLNGIERLQHFIFPADDADQILHGLLHRESALIWPGVR